MAQEQNLAQLLNEEFIIECIEQDNLQKINNLIKKLKQVPIDYDRRCRTIRTGWWATASIPITVVDIFDLMVEYNYLNALRAGAKQYPIEDWGIFVLEKASKRGNQAVVELLLKEKANPFDNSSQQRNTPLHLAIIHDHAHIIESLVQSLKTPPLDEKSSSSRKWHPGLSQEFLEKTTKNAELDFTALDYGMQKLYLEARYQFIACYAQLRDLMGPFDATIAQEAVAQFYVKLPGTMAQTYFNVVAKLFEAGAHDPSQPNFIFERSPEMMSTRSMMRACKKLVPFFTESVFKPHVMALFKKPKYAAALAFLGGMHHRAGARSLFHQLQRSSTIFDPQVLRLPLKLAGAPKKSAVTSAFFLPADTTATASSASSALTTRVEEAPRRSSWWFF